MYEPRPRQHLSAAEEAEFLEQQAMERDDTSPRTAQSDHSLSDSLREEREATLRAASVSPGVSVSFDDAHTHEQRSGKKSRRRRVPEPEQGPAPAARLSFAERFGGTQPGAAEPGRTRPASSTLSPGMDDAVQKHLSPRSRDAGSAAADVGQSTGAKAGGSGVRGTSTHGPGAYGTGPYRMNHGLEPYQMSRGPATRRAPRINKERFDVRSWADEQRRASEAPTLRHFYSEIRTIH